MSRLMLHDLVRRVPAVSRSIPAYHRAQGRFSSQCICDRRQYKQAWLTFLRLAWLPPPLEPLSARRALGFDEEAPSVMVVGGGTEVGEEFRSGLGPEEPSHTPSNASLEPIPEALLAFKNIAYTILETKLNYESTAERKE